ncbi:MAG: hypothetical protein ACO1NM_09080 [Sphingobium phenoxybenzoativorans]
MRLLIALLIACLTAPALAAAHCAEPAPAQEAAVSHHGHEGHAPSSPDPMPAKAMAAHECIGCIPPTHGLARFAASVRHVLALRHDRTAPSLRLASAPAPETPPPKRLV